MINFQEVYIVADQPTSCPQCGSRTDILLDLSHIRNQTQIHKCINEECANLFVVEKD